MRRTPRLATAAFVAVAVSTAMLFLMPSVASAQQPVDCTDPVNLNRQECLGASQIVTQPNVTVSPVEPGSGVSHFVQADVEHSGDPTLYERFGSGSYQLNHKLGALEFGQKAANEAVSMVLGFAMAITGFAVGLLQHAFTFELGDALVEVGAEIAERMRVPYSDPLLKLGITLAALSAVWWAAQRRVSRAASTIVIGLLATVAAFGYLTQPLRTLGFVADTATQAGRIGLSVVGELPSAGGGPDEALRVASDRIWRTYVHTPWIWAQFGDIERGERYAERMLEVNTYTPDEVARIRDGGERARQEVLRDHQDAYDKLLEEIRENDPGVYQHVVGDRLIGQRFAPAGFAVLMSLALLLLVLVASLVMCALLVGVLALGVAAPFTVALAAVPGVGRQLAVNTARFALVIIVYRALLGVLLAVSVVVSGMFVEAADTAAGMGGNFLLWLALFAALIMFRANLTRGIGASVSWARQPIPGMQTTRTVAAAVATSGVVTAVTNRVREAPRAALERIAPAETVRGNVIDRKGDPKDDEAAGVLRGVASRHGRHTEPWPAVAGRSNGQRREPVPVSTNGDVPRRNRQPAAAAQELPTPQQPILLPTRSLQQSPAWHHSIPDHAKSHADTARLLPVVDRKVPQQPRQPAPAPVDADAPRWQLHGPATPPHLRQPEVVPGTEPKPRPKPSDPPSEPPVRPRAVNPQPDRPGRKLGGEGRK